MATDARPVATPQAAGLDPFGTVWRLLANAKFALTLIALAVLFGLIGVVVPQLPEAMRGNAAAKAAWIELRRDDYGAFTGPMDRLGMFEIFQAPWFVGLWIVIIVAVTVCAVSRFRPTARSIHRPQREVSERYFETAHHRADYTHPGGAATVEAALRKRRYRVERVREADGTAYLFAERFGWSHYGTFVSHLALLMVLVGSVLTKFGGYNETFALAEGNPGIPIFATPGGGQIFVKMVDAVRGVDATGNIVDFRSHLEVTRGDRAVTCTSTVNDPCSAFGYKFHQAAFFDDLARLKVTAPNGQVVFDQVVDFNAKSTIVPAFRVTNAVGQVLFEGAVAQLATDTGLSDGREDDVALGELAFPVSSGSDVYLAYALSWRVVGSELRVGIAGGGFDQPRGLSQGESVADVGFRVEYLGPRAIPALRVDDLPGADGPVTFQLTNDPASGPRLAVAGLSEDVAFLSANAPVEFENGYSYEFRGRLDGAGIDVRRDPGDTFLWVAVGMAMLGLGMTFYLPRRRLWVKVTPARSYFAGIAEKPARYGRELRRMGAEMGSRDALRPEDVREDG